jgi:hypothetical protein
MEFEVIRRVFEIFYIKFCYTKIDKFKISQNTEVTILTFYLFEQKIKLPQGFLMHILIKPKLHQNLKPPQ